VASSSAPIVDRIRIIPRPEDFLDRNVGASGELFYNRETSSLRAYNGRDRGGYEIARADLGNISNSDFAAKATSAGITAATPDWDDVTNKPTFATVATSGSYNDLTNTPTIPDLTGYATENYVDNAVSSINGGSSSTFSFSVGADDSTLRTISTDESIQFIGGTGITTTSDAEGNITITATTGAGTFAGLTEAGTASLTIDKIYQPAITMYRVDNVGTTAYTFAPHYTGNNPTVYAISGLTIAFDLDNIGGHPFELQDNALNPFSTGLVHVASNGTISTGSDAQGKDSGTLYWTPPETEGGTFVYQCQTHASMFGVISVKRFSTL